MKTTLLIIALILNHIIIAQLQSTSSPLQEGMLALEVNGWNLYAGSDLPPAQQ